jgi:hypothetical protein
MPTNKKRAALFQAPSLMSPSSPTLARSPLTPSSSYDLGAARRAKQFVAGVFPALVWPQQFVLVLLPVAIYTAQQHRQTLSNITVLGPPIDKVLQYTPTIKETCTFSWPVALTKVVSGSVVHSFGGNPVAENVFRDIPKAFSVLWARFSGLELGSSGYKYGWDNVITATIKPPCKTAIIILARNKEAGGILANFVCEPLAHASSLIERDLQDINKEATLQATLPEYLRLVSNNTNILGLTFRSMMALPSKAIAPKLFMDYAWIRFSMHAALTSTCYGLALAVQTLIVKGMTGKQVAFTPKDGIYSHIRQSYTAAQEHMVLARLLVASTAVLTNVVPTLAIEFYNTYILLSILRPIQYGFDWTIAKITTSVPAWAQPLLDPIGTIAIVGTSTGFLAMNFAHVGIRSALTVSVPTSLIVVAVDAGLTYSQYQQEHQLSHASIVFVECLVVTSFIAPSLLVSIGVCSALSVAVYMYNNVSEEAETVPTESNAETIPVQIAGEQQPDNLNPA